MDYEYLGVIALLAVLFVIYFIYSQKSIKGLKRVQQPSMLADVIPTAARPETSGDYVERLADVSFETEDGDCFLECSEISKFPTKASELDVDDINVGGKVHLISDVIKAGLNTQSRHIELVFKTDIQAQLNSGAAVMMKTKQGEVLADAITKNTGKICGKARIVRAGRLKQVAAGAYNLLSIVVAQSHLSDINKELKSISSKLDRIIMKLDNNDKTKIKGTISYLINVYQDIDDGKGISDFRKQEFESCIRISHELFEMVVSELEMKIGEIKKCSEADFIGSGDTHEELEKLIGNVNTTIEKYEFYLQLVLLIKMIRIRLDPAGIDFSDEKIDFECVNELLKKYEAISKQKISILIKSHFNFGKTLELRAGSLSQIVSNQLLRVEYNTHKVQTENVRIEQGLESYLNNKEYRMALSYDEGGELSKAAMLR